MSQTQIILIVAALVVIAFFFWRSMREERRMRASRKARLQAGGDVRKDVLAEEKPEPRVEPQLEDMVDDDEPHEAVQSDLPSEKPPVYERFAEEQKARLEREAARGGRKAGRIAGIEKPPVDHGIQWGLDVTSYEGKTFPLGSMDSLVTQIRQLSLPLPVSLWAKSAEDGLYYPSECLPAEAVHIVATILIANRAAVLDDVSASSFLQVLEQTAAQNDVDVRTSCDIKTAVSTAVQISRFIHVKIRIGGELGKVPLLHLIVQPVVDVRVLLHLPGHLLLDRLGERLQISAVLLEEICQRNEFSRGLVHIVDLG